MARGDAIFARCNVDWPNDPRCDLLPDNNARWLNHLLWLWCTKDRSEKVPEEYSPKYMGRMCGISERKIQSSLRSMAELGLIAVSGDGSLVVVGVKNQNSRLEWKSSEIGEVTNPWENDPNYLWHNGVPVKGISVPNRKEQEHRKEHRKEQEQNTERLRVAFKDLFWPLYPRKIKKSEVEDIWISLNLDDGQIAEIITSLKLQVNSIEWADERGKYIPHPTTYLNKARWTDVLTPRRKSSEPELENFTGIGARDKEWRRKAREADEAQAQRHTRAGTTTPDGPEPADFGSVGGESS